MSVRHSSALSRLHRVDNCVHAEYVHVLRCLWYVGVVGADGEIVENGKPSKEAKARYEWEISDTDWKMKDTVDVRFHDAKHQGIPRPAAWTRRSAADVRKLCVEAESEATRDLPSELRERGAKISCQSQP